MSLNFNILIAMNTYLNFKCVSYAILLFFCSCSKNKEVPESSTQNTNIYFDSFNEIDISTFKEYVFLTFLASKNHSDSFEDFWDPSQKYSSHDTDRVVETFAYYKLQYPTNQDLKDEFKKRRFIDKTKSQVTSVLTSVKAKPLFAYKLKGNLKEYNFASNNVLIETDEIFKQHFKITDTNYSIYSNRNIDHEYSLNFMPDPGDYYYIKDDSWGYNERLFLIYAGQNSLENLLDSLQDRNIYLKLIYDIGTEIHYHKSVLDDLYPINTVSGNIKFVQLFKDSLCQFQIGAIGPDRLLYIKENNTIKTNDYFKTTKEILQQKQNDEFLKNVFYFFPIVFVCLLAYYSFRDRFRKN